MAPDGSSGGDACEEAKAHSDLAWIESAVFAPSCALAGCHRSPATSAGHLVLDSGLSRAQMINTASTSATSWMRVVPGDPGRSYLLVAMGAASGPKPSDGLMPLGTRPLCTAKLDAIRRWIEAGAPP